jgi:hypothetical protein
MAWAHFRVRLFWHALAWTGVTGILYIVGRYVIYPAQNIEYTALVAWFIAFGLAIVAGGLGVIWGTHWTRFKNRV